MRRVINRYIRKHVAHCTTRYIGRYVAQCTTRVYREAYSPVYTRENGITLRIELPSYGRTEITLRIGPPSSLWGTGITLRKEPSFPWQVFNRCDRHASPSSGRSSTDVSKQAPFSPWQVFNRCEERGVPGRWWVGVPGRCI